LNKVLTPSKARKELEDYMKKVERNDEFLGFYDSNQNLSAFADFLKIKQ
jgi:hypothetical protein